MAKEEITKGMTFQEALEKSPEAAGIMMKYGLHCIGCHIAPFETIEQGCLSHGIDKQDIDKMIKEINREMEKQR